MIKSYNVEIPGYAKKGSKKKFSGKYSDAIREFIESGAENAEIETDRFNSAKLSSVQNALQRSVRLLGKLDVVGVIRRSNRIFLIRKDRDLG